LEYRACRSAAPGANAVVVMGVRIRPEYPEGIKAGLPQGGCEGGYSGRGLNATKIHDGNRSRLRHPRSAQFVPNAPTAAVLVQVAAPDQGAEMLLERVAAGAGQLDCFAHGDATMLAGKLDDLQ
jgi:hypothetical protein